MRHQGDMHITLFMKRKIMGMYKDGCSRAWIAERTGIPYRSVQRIIRQELNREIREQTTEGADNDGKNTV